MSVYATVAMGAQTVRNYQGQWLDYTLTRTEYPQMSTAELQKVQLDLVRANQNLQFANDVMGLVLRNISQLQP